MQGSVSLSGTARFEPRPLPLELHCGEVDADICPDMTSGYGDWFFLSSLPAWMYQQQLRGHEQACCHVACTSMTRWPCSRRCMSPSTIFTCSARTLSTTFSWAPPTTSPLGTQARVRP